MFLACARGFFQKREPRSEAGLSLSLLATRPLYEALPLTIVGVPIAPLTEPEYAIWPR